MTSQNLRTLTCATAAFTFVALAAACGPGEVILAENQSVRADTGGDVANNDVGTDTAEADVNDTGPVDTGGDVGPEDTGPLDTGPVDTGPVDTGNEDTGPEDTGPDTAPVDVGVDTTPPVETDGWIGSACGVDSDCTFADASCLTGEHPGGMCSVDCDRFCPDLDGSVGTFCTDTALTDGGWCHARCDYGEHPGSGCRDGYMCSVVPRAGEEAVQVGACVLDDGSGPELSECMQWLVDRGVSFEPTNYPPQQPAGASGTCTIDEPLRLNSPVNGVNYRYYYNEAPTPMLMGCELARSLYEAGDVLAEYGITEFVHIGTQNCRVIAGTSTLSQHSFGNAIDISEFRTDAGVRYSVIEHWEHDTTSFNTDAGRILYEIAYAFYDLFIFNTILTPNYNSAHDNHFHVDLTADRHFIKSNEGHSCGGH